MNKSGSSRRKLGKNRSQSQHRYQTRSRTSSSKPHLSTSRSARVKRKASPRSCSISVNRRRSLKKIISSKKFPRTSSSSSSSSSSSCASSSTFCNKTNGRIENTQQNPVCRSNNDDTHSTGPSRICKPKRKTKLKPPKSKPKSKCKSKSKSKIRSKSKSKSKRKSKPESSEEEKQNETEVATSSSSNGNNNENVAAKEFTNNNNNNDESATPSSSNSNEVDPNTMFSTNGCFIAPYEWMDMIKSPMDPNIYQVVRFPNKLVALLISKENPLDLDLTLLPDPKTFCHPQVQQFNEKFVQMHQDLGKDPEGQNLLEKVISFPWTVNVDTIPDKDVFSLNENNNNNDKDQEWSSEDKKPKYSCNKNSRPCGSSSASAESGENPEIEIESDLPRGPKYGVSICVMVGAINDPKEYPGMAHLTEHCVFEGTKKYANSSNILFDCCTIVNASTERDRTVYYAHVESWATLQTVVPIMADMMTSPLLKDEIVCSEISIVDSESCIRQSFDSVRCHDLLCSLSKENDPLRLYACGDLSTLNKPGIIPALRNWHAKYYRPSNMIVSIEGPVPVKDLLRVVAINFYNIHDDTVNPKINTNTDSNSSSNSNTKIISQGKRQKSNPSAKSKVKRTASSRKVKACTSLLTRKKSSITSGENTGSGFGKIHELKLPFDLQNVSRVYVVNPFQDSQSMILTWILSPDAWLNHSTKPLSYITTLLGRQGEGSLHSYLLHKGYIINCRSYHTNQFYYTNCHKYSSLIIKLELTKEGLNNSAEVLKAVFSYIRMLRQAGPKRRIFDELRTKSAHIFHFRCEQYKTAQLLAVALNVMRLQKGVGGSPKLAMTSSVLVTKYDPTLIANYLEQLTLDNLNIMLVSPTFASLAIQQHPNILTEFGVMDLGPELKYELSQIRPYMDFTLPPPNIFVDEDICRPIRNTVGGPGFGSGAISGCGPSDKLALERSMLVKEVSWKLTCSGKASIICHHIDSSEWEGPRRPETATYAFLITSGQGQSPNSSAINSAMMDLWVELLKLKVKERFYPALLADIKFDIAVADNGISIYIDGQSKWLPTIWFGILEEFTHFERSMGRNMKLWEDFKSYQEKMYGNSILDAETYAYDLKLWLTSCSHNLSTYLQQILAELSFEEFIEFTRSFKCRMWIFVQLFGCVTKSALEKIASSILKLDYGPLSAREIARNHTFVIPRGDRCLRVKARTEKCHNSFIINCYQFGCLSYEDEIICQILVRRITPYLFNHIRTKEQIGYRVWTLYENSYSVSSIEIWVNTQADKFTTGYVDERIDDGLACFYKEHLCSDEKIREVFKIKPSPGDGKDGGKKDDDEPPPDDEDDNDDDFDDDDDERKDSSNPKQTDDNNTKTSSDKNQVGDSKSDSNSNPGQSQSQSQDKSNQKEGSTTNSDSAQNPSSSTNTTSTPSTSVPNTKSSKPGKKNLEKSSANDDLNKKKRGSRYTKERAEDMLLQREILRDPDFPNRVRTLYKKNLPTSTSESTSTPSAQKCTPLYRKISIQVVGSRRWDDSSPKDEQFLEDKLEKFRRVNGDPDRGDSGDGGGGKGNRKSGGSVVLDLPDCVPSKDRTSNNGYFIIDPNSFRKKLMIYPNLYE